MKEAGVQARVTGEVFGNYKEIIREAVSLGGRLCW